jgi:hypothetical protein
MITKVLISVRSHPQPRKKITYPPAFPPGWDQQDSPNGYRTVTVSCNVFKDGDNTQVSSTLLAKTLIAREECRKGGLQPSFR